MDQSGLTPIDVDREQEAENSLYYYLAVLLAPSLKCWIGTLYHQRTQSEGLTQAPRYMTGPLPSYCLPFPSSVPGRGHHQEGLLFLLAWNVDQERRGRAGTKCMLGFVGSGAGCSLRQVQNPGQHPPALCCRIFKGVTMPLFHCLPPCIVSSPRALGASGQMSRVCPELW